MATLHVGKSTPLSQLYEVHPLVSACSPKPQKSKEDVVRGGEKEKNREKPSKELEVCVLSRGGGKLATQSLTKPPGCALLSLHSNGW